MYEYVLADTLKILKELPAPIPSKGRIAGIIKEYIANRQPASTGMFQDDNLHFPMGTAYLTLGIRGVAEKAAESAKKAESPRAVELLNGVVAVYDEISNYLKRYAKVVSEAAGDDQRLLHIGENLKNLSEKAPAHFDEALQLVYMMWKLRGLQTSEGDIGRLDVRLRSWFEKDIASGYITEDDALDQLCGFWELIHENNSGDTLIQVMLGGRNPDGSDAGGHLSALMLEATKRCKLSDPHISVRVHPNLHPDTYKAMLEVQLLGMGQASMYNDEVVIPNLVRFGIPEELACCYTTDGCTEIMLDTYSTILFNHIDVVGTFELAFNNGDWAERTYREKVQYYHKNNAATFYTPDAIVGFAAGRPEECETFEEFYQLFLKQYKFQVRNRCCQHRRTHMDRLAGAASSILVNGTFDTVLDSGKDMLAGGLPFDEYMIFSGAIPTVADCLIAVKHLVYEKKCYTISQIKEAIRVNYEGYETMRQQMLSAPKFGNDIDEVDYLAADIASHFCQWIEDYREETGFAIMPAFLQWEFLREAYGTAATPDGRRYGDPIAEHYCATPGRATNGPTALIRSISKASDAIARAVGVCVVHVTLPGNLGNSNEESLVVLDALNTAAIAGELNEMNIAIYDKKRLLAAQKDPENHKDLIVRVWGYSARFVDLCEGMQNHVISRIPQNE